MLWTCRGCTAAYSVGAPACPQCGSNEYVEDWNMPKISKGDGLTLEDATPAQDPQPEPVAEPTVPEEPEPTPAPAPKSGKG